MNLPTNIKQWLNDRGIIDSVIERNNITWNGSQIVIPIYDEQGQFLFNKYRKDPFSDNDDPKYKYDAGAKSTLYNRHKLAWVDWTKPIIICEGEMDCLALDSIGMFTLSSTGGSGTFKDEWINLLKKGEIFICYDNDDAGYKGAAKIISKLPNAHWVILPDSVGDHGDVTDFLKGGGDFYDLMRDAESYSMIHFELDELKTIKGCKQFIQEYNERSNEFWRLIRHEGKQHLRELVAINGTRIGELKRHIGKIRYENSKADDIFNHPVNSNGITSEHIKAAKEVPITDFYFYEKTRRVGSTLIGRCPFHSDKTPSFTIYLESNTFHCFGCSAGSDTIDYVMKDKEINFLQAVRAILKL